jgi:hypothetical protein
MDSRSQGSRRVVAAACVALALFGAGCGSAEPLLTVEAAAFAPSLGGTIGLAQSIATDINTINLSSDLGLGGTEVVPYLRGEVVAGGFDFALSGFRTSQSGHGTVTADFGHITAGSNVDTDLDLGLAHGHVAWNFLETEWVDVGAGLGADYVDLSLKAEDKTFAMTESIAVRQAVPLVEARAAFRVPVVPIDLELSVGGITGSYDQIDGTVFDAEALLRGRIAGPLSLFAGYRYVHFDIKGSSNSQSFDGDVVLSGFMLGASLRF